MLSDDYLRQCNPVFVTPCFGGVATINFIRSVLALQDAISRNGFGGEIRIGSGDSLVTRARNEIVAGFLANPAYTHLFWIDADVGFTPDQVFRLLKADRDVAAGAYPIKKLFWPESIPADMSQESFHARCLRYPVNATNGTEPMRIAIDADGFAEVSEAPTGFMVIRRNVLERMAEKLPELGYRPDGLDNMPPRQLHYRFFDTMIEPETGRYLSEDYAFCRRWRDMGGRVHIDMHAKLSHQGNYLYQGDFGATFAIEPSQAIWGAEIQDRER